MPQIQPASLAKVENVFRADLKGKQVAIRLAKENGVLRNAKIFNVTRGNEDIVSSYSFGSKTSPLNRARIMLTEEISQICEKAKEGAKLFADIMGWVK